MLYSEQIGVRDRETSITTNRRSGGHWGGDGRYGNNGAVYKVSGSGSKSLIWSPTTVTRAFIQAPGAARLSSYCDPEVDLY